MMKKALSLNQGANLIAGEGLPRKSEAGIGAVDKSKTATATETSVVKEKPKDVFPMFKKAVKRPASAMIGDGENISSQPTSKSNSQSASNSNSQSSSNSNSQSASNSNSQSASNSNSQPSSNSNSQPSTSLQPSINLQRPTSFALINYLKEPQWKAGLIAEFKAPYMKKIEEYLKEQYEKKIIVRPPKDEIFNAFNLTPLKEVKVVILGQDPYHGTDQAHGLSFSVKKGVAMPPSLINIYKELAEDIEGFNIPKHGNLMGWATQGVFMLNAALSVELHKANSHSQIGWHTFTDRVIQFVSKNVKHCVFLLWGAYAQKKVELIDRKRHTVIMTPHPSPLSCHRGFSGSRCFSRVNKALKDHEMKPIDWNHLP